ncbi:MAG: hypothetical protein Q9207_001720 [Kuettlingeria erythrocarpa]
MVVQGVRILARKYVPFSVASALGKRPRVEGHDEGLQNHLSPPKKPMIIPAAVPSGSLSRLRRSEHDDQYELGHTTGQHLDSSSDFSGKTMAEEMAALFNPSSIAQGSDTVESSVQRAQSRPKNIPRSRLSPKRRHERAEMDNPSIPSISEEDLAEVSALLTPRSKERQAEAALEEPSTLISIGSAVSSQSSKRLPTDSPPSPATWSPRSINLEAMGPSRKKMEMLEYKRTLKRREQLKGAIADGSAKSARVNEWMDGIGVIRSRSWSLSPRQIHNIAIRRRTT